jgi:thiol:disulfide interchange protein/DsbC/DsbD-like thiol-disulfide interchange protein
MTATRVLLGWVGLGVLLTSGRAAPATMVSLLLEDTAARPGDTVMAGLRLRMAPGWHTYWRNPGESGSATALDWRLPEGITAGPIQWPVPGKLVDLDLTTYVYEGEVILLVPLTLSTNLTPGPKLLKARVSWQECQRLCVLGKAEVEAPLEVGTERRQSPEAAAFAAARARLPKPAPDFPISARWKPEGQPNDRSLVLEIGMQGVLDFLPFEDQRFEMGGAVERTAGANGGVTLEKSLKKTEGDWPARIRGLILAKAGAGDTGFEVSFPVSAPPVSATAALRTSPTPAAVSAPAAQPLGLMLLSALLGGLILNVMPCVLPVIALKILGFVKQSRSAPGQVRRLGLIYGAGVLASFLVLAVLVITVKAAGQRASWGMQFGSPVFLVLLTTLVTLVALNLFGVFEVTLGSDALSAAGELAGREGPAGAFFNGVLATALATPCTAPFLGAALGFAFAQPPSVILLIFLTVGVGLALPYVVLSWHPAWLKFLPKPGRWMERFKIAMGFPMLATALWLFTLTAEHYSEVFWLGMFLVTVALAAWIYGEFVQRGRTRKGLATGLAAAVLAFGYGYGLEKEQRWRAPSATPAADARGVLREGPDGIEWRAWSPAAVAKAREEGRPVFVDFTARWCVTCNANKKTSIEIPSVRAKLKEINAVSLLGDYTRTPPEITDELARFGRAGVPLVLVYPKDPNRPPVVLPELLTPGIVLAALTKAAQL